MCFSDKEESCGFSIKRPIFSSRVFEKKAISSCFNECFSETEYGTYEYRNFVRERIYAARKKARQARFEYGETPEVRGYR